MLLEKKMIYLFIQHSLRGPHFTARATHIDNVPEPIMEWTELNMKLLNLINNNHFSIRNMTMFPPNTLISFHSA